MHKRLPCGARMANGRTCTGTLGRFFNWLPEKLRPLGRGENAGAGEDVLVCPDCRTKWAIRSRSLRGAA